MKRNKRCGAPAPFGARGMKAASGMLLGVAFSALALNVQAAAQRLNSWEYSIDIPWRMEPQPYWAGVPSTHGSIPVYVLIADGFMKSLSSPCIVEAMKKEVPCDIPEWPKRVLYVDVNEVQSPSQAVRYHPSDFFSIERTVNYWKAHSIAQAHNATPYFDTIERCEPDGDGGQICIEDQVPARNQVHQLKCYDNECSTQDTYVSDTSEWHGLLYYTPSGQPTPDGDIVLHIQAAVEMDNGETRLLKSTLRTHLGEAPLPKFGFDWAYGDLHYHAQGTDNVGEMGYSYAAAMHAMNAIGLDFVFATDHASNNRQVAAVAHPTGGADWAIWNYTFAPDFAQLGDMSPTRWKNHWHLLNGVDGNPYTGRTGLNDNGEMLKYHSRRNSQYKVGLSLPQIFLGGEVDIIPEAAFHNWNGSYARLGIVAGGRMDAKNGCRALPYWTGVALATLSDDFSLPHAMAGHSICDVADLFESSYDGVYLVRNISGTELDYARQHLLHLPSDGSRDDAGVMSNTSRFGAASRRHKDMLAEDYEAEEKGYHFLAHPVTMASGVKNSRIGPDIMPYSEVQLKEAMKSPYVLGLQSWNENERMESKVHSDIFRIDNGVARTEEDCVTGQWQWIQDPTGAWFKWCTKPKVRDFYSPEVYEYNPYHDLVDGSFRNRKYSRWREIFAGLALFDTVNMWGINKEFSQLDWLGSNSPRKWFVAGGSDAHGDFNHLRDGYYKGTSSVNDTAMGKPRNLVRVGPPQKTDTDPAGMIGVAFTQSQVLNGLKSGEFSVTDGPAIRIAIDMNGNGVIDEGDIMMGQHLELSSVSSSTELDVLVEYKSTPEFGYAGQINLWLGVRSNSAGIESRYGPQSTHPIAEEKLAGENIMKGNLKVYRYNALQGHMYSHDFRRASATGSSDLYGDEERGYHAVSGLRRLFGFAENRYSGTHRFRLKLDDFRAMQLIPTSVSGEVNPRRISGTPRLPDAMWIRADFTTKEREYCEERLSDKCLPRYAVTNPVWAVKTGWKN